MKIGELVTIDDVVGLWKESGNYRSEMIKKLPHDIEWYKCEIDNEDLDNIYHIYAPDWIQITNNTFQVEDLKFNFNYPPKFLNNKQRDDFYNHVSRIQFIINEKKLINPVMGLVLIARNENGPFTIYDGNHRFAANYIINSERLNDCIFFGKAYIGISKNLKSSEHHLHPSNEI
ncbi:hypothetical protein [Algoriphagus sp. PAP.12]|uniref:hypothetical protein n=1 Tax=Algoriphagus sp. PAP.12 TaxID=2996678 RepID=UPI00227D0E83|nr:hypothetical protein [Algoriphagus sp. PAP.12]